MRFPLLCPASLHVLAASVLGALAPPAGGQQPVEKVEALERIIITGSNVKRTDQETVAPVQIITREEIERSGAQSVAEMLAKQPYTGAALIETPNTDAHGASSVSLRSLGAKATLVLLNGRRVSGYGYSLGFLDDTFVDLSAIPTVAVERIEVLKDGASAIYGSDAIAGVVNVILRRDYQGFGVAANVGTYQGKHDWRATLIAGAGDPARDGFNAFAMLDYYRRDGLTMADTSFGHSRDYRDRQGGRNFQSITGGGTWVGSGPANSTAGNLRRAYAECTNVQDYAGVVALGLVPVNQSALPSGTGINQPGNTWCVRDWANTVGVVPPTERIGVLARGTLELTSTLQAYAEVGGTRNATDFVWREPALQGSTRFYPAPPPTTIAYSPLNVNFAPGVAGNPLPVNASYAGALNDFGVRRGPYVSDALRLLAGVKWAIDRWDVDSAVLYSRSEVKSEMKSQLTQGTIAAFGITDAQQPPTPISRSAVYNLDRPSTNAQSVRDSMVGMVPRKSQAELKMIDVRATTEIGRLPGGPVGIALGGEYRQESMRGGGSPFEQAGGVLNSSFLEVNESRTDLAMFGELALPLTRELEGQVALRYDRYSDFGSALMPKLGLKFRPVPQWLMRATWGRGFKAPTLVEVSPTVSFVASTVYDPIRDEIVTVANSLAGNPLLQPEESRTFTAGIVFEPTPNFSVGVDFYDIRWVNRTGGETLDSIIANPSDPRNYRDPATGVLVAVQQTWLNEGASSTQGLDFDVRYSTSSLYGRFGSRLLATYVRSFERNGEQTVGTDAEVLVLGLGSAIPRWKGQWMFDWQAGPWTAQATINYVHHYWRVFGPTVSPSFYSPGTPNRIPQTGQLDPRAPSVTTVDLFARYNVTRALSATVSVINLTDKEPLFDPVFGTLFADWLSGYDIRGRVIRVGAQYNF